MSEMIERVAQALVAANHEANSIILPWDRQKEPAREIALAQARAAIAAMRDPTEAMLARTLRQVGQTGRLEMLTGAAWQAMIDAALSDT